jgi:peptidyl-prolyl cis-trans isomerase SurA
MTHPLKIPAWTAVLLAACALSARAGDVLDRVVAAVNGHIVLNSDWEDAIRYEAFIAGRRLDQVTAGDQKSALDRLIDQELLKEQLHDTQPQPESEEETAKQIQRVRRQYPDAESDQGWQTELAGYGLTAGGLKQRIVLQLNLTRLVEARLRPNVNVDAKSIESYYHQELLPQLRQSGAREIALGEVTPQIRELLIQQQVNQLLSAWLENLRASSEIRTLSAQPDSATEAR